MVEKTPNEGVNLFYHYYRKLLQNSPAVLLNEPRQSRKTMIMELIAKDH